ncbi:PrpF domain-containing protein [Mycolicibacterium neoaurum]|uniref:3-methylitaconate isomerase n=1 Tax=Mycolicibacterium neoaurum TaxID=1795 RepID=A0AAV2WJH4_MYCNE|nr:PrpF domain-containing protein [Mycolicibacterium neoaurum]QVI25883.1 PrpF, AcnD-accessory [Mycolicibacterium neoaurum]CDQ44405.1 3-methylitaconate isomerase [Mycolicibacterium neoaurum]
MRGGTSKCWLFNAVDVDPIVDHAGGLDALLTSAFGSGDPRQLDGVGGGSSTTSKAAIVRRSSHPDIDIDYQFAQIAIADRRVEWASNCGNCATAIGLYALQSGLVPVDDEVTAVRLRHQVSGAVLTATISTPGGKVPTEGTAAVPGTTALGVPVGLSFTGLDAAPVLPTGRPVDFVDACDRTYRATLVATGAPAALFDASDLGLDGTESNAEFAHQTPLLMELRKNASLQMGLRRFGDPVSNSIPKVGIVGAARDYRTTAGALIGADDYDVSVRMLSMLAPHPAIGLTSAVALAAAATVRDGVLSGLTLHQGAPLRIGTAAGVLPVDLGYSPDGRLATVTLHRAARRIASAELFVSEAAHQPIGA